jgi:hypothetical protein
MSVAEALISSLPGFIEVLITSLFQSWKPVLGYDLLLFFTLRLV